MAAPDSARQLFACGPASNSTRCTTLRRNEASRIFRKARSSFSPSAVALLPSPVTGAPCEPGIFSPSSAVDLRADIRACAAGFMRLDASRYFKPEQLVLLYDVE